MAGGRAGPTGVSALSDFPSSPPHLLPLPLRADAAATGHFLGATSSYGRLALGDDAAPAVAARPSRAHNVSRVPHLRCAPPPPLLLLSANPAAHSAGASPPARPPASPMSPDDPLRRYTYF